MACRSATQPRLIPRRLEGACGAHLRTRMAATVEPVLLIRTLDSMLTVSEKRSTPGDEDWCGFTGSGAKRPAARRASSICAVPKTGTIAATVAVSFAGSVRIGCGGHLISSLWHVTMSRSYKIGACISGVCKSS